MVNIPARAGNRLKLCSVKYNKSRQKKSKLIYLPQFEFIGLNNIQFQAKKTSSIRSGSKYHVQACALKEWLNRPNNKWYLKKYYSGVKVYFKLLPT